MHGFQHCRDRTLAQVLAGLAAALFYKLMIVNLLVIRPSLTVYSLLFSSLTHGHAAAACPEVPAPRSEVRSASIYGSSKRLDASVDRRSSATRELLTQGINRFMQTIAHEADKASRSGSREVARCALDAMSNWAQHGALQGQTNGEAANKELIWNSAGLALAYLRLMRFSETGDRKIIEPWLMALADRVIDRYSKSSRHDNIYAWVALVAASKAAVTGRSENWFIAVRMHDSVLREIDANGSLPLELQRGSRSLAYHNFALVPLLVTAILRGHHGYRISDSSRNRLARLVRFTEAAMKDRSILAHMTGKVQEDPGTRNYQVWARLAPRFVPGFSPSPEVSENAFERWLGGSAKFFASY